MTEQEAGELQEERKECDLERNKMQITKKQAKDFLNLISQDDKVAIIHHDDLDGFASGILLYDFCELKKAKKVEHFVFQLGKSSEKDFNLESFNKILITDLAPNMISDLLEKFKEKDILYIDHHIKDIEIPNEILELRTPREYSASKTVLELINTHKEFLKISALIADAGWLNEQNVKELQPFLKELDITLEKIKEQAYETGYTLIYFDKELNKVFDIFKKIKEWKEIEELKKYSQPVKEEVEEFLKDFQKNHEKIGSSKFYYFEPEFEIKSLASNALSYPYPEETIILATPFEDKIRISARNQNKKTDMAELLKAGIKNLKNSSSGGHVPAAGGFIQKQDLNKFKQNLKEFLIKNKKIS